VLPSASARISLSNSPASDSGPAVSRDNLDENGGRQSEFEAAAGSEGMIALSPKFRKRFSSGPLFDCR
jgi:hypothetical protein